MSMSGNLKYSYDSLPQTFSGNVPFDHFPSGYFNKITNIRKAAITPLNKRSIFEFLKLQMPCVVTYILLIFAFKGYRHRILDL